MTKLNQKGGINGLLIALIFSILLLIGAISFGVWAYGGMQDYKNNVDAKIATAVEVAEQKLSTQKDKEFVQKEKNPLKTYDGPGTYGSVSIKYPKTWSAYVVQQDGGGTPIDGYFHPNFVPGIQTKTGYALRVQVVPTSYDLTLKQYGELIKVGKLKASAYRAPNVSNVLGTKLIGTFPSTKVGEMVAFPLRDKTLLVFTEADQFKADFEGIILKNMKFVP